MKRGAPAPRDLAAEIDAAHSTLKDALREGRPTAAIRATLADLGRLEAMQDEADGQRLAKVSAESGRAISDAAESLAAKSARALSDRLAEFATPTPPWGIA